jgi:hypothetical protein
MRRLLLTTLVLGASIALARGVPLHPYFQGGALASAREMAAYRVDAGGVRFPLGDGVRRVRVLVNLDLPPGADPEGVEFTVRVRIPEEPYDERFALVGMARVRRDGGPAAFYLGEGTLPAWGREIALERRHLGAATLDVSLVAPASASGAVRVLAEADRAPLAAGVLARRDGPVERNQLAAALGPLDWDQLPAALQADLLQRRWARIAASPGTPFRRLYVAGPPAPIAKPAEPVGELVEAGQVAAYTVQGPGTLRLVAEGAPIRGSVELLSADGERRAQPLALSACDRLDLAVGSQVTTARVRVDAQSQLLVIASDRKLAVGAARLEARPDGEWVLHPSVALERNPRAEPGPAPPVVYDLRGRGGRELHLTARLRARPGDPPTLARVRWTMRDAQGREVASGELAQPVAPAPEDRIDEEPDAVPSDPVLGHLWPPPTAATLEIAADPPALIAVDSPGFDPPPGRPDDPIEKPVTALRHAPVERPLWFRVRPSNEQALLAAGRVERLRSATRLEAVPEPPPPTVQAETLKPLAGGPRFTVLVPGNPDAPPAELGVWWPLANGMASSVRFDAPGASPGARLPWNVLFLGDATRTKQEAAIRIDGADAARTRLFTSRGVVAAPPATPGVHRVEVTIERRTPRSGPAPRLFVDRPVGAQTPFRAFSVFPIAAGRRTTARLEKASEPRSLGAVVYFDRPPGQRATLEVTIDGGRRALPPARWSRLRSRITRALPLHAEALPGATYLNRTTRAVWGTAPLFVGLGDDIAAGPHLISMVLRGTSAKAFVRLFSYGGPQHRPERVATFGEFRSDP